MFEHCKVVSSSKKREFRQASHGTNEEQAKQQKKDQ